MDSNHKLKNSKQSIHNKYKRRLESLKLLLADFVHHVDMKLDRSLSGNIRNRDLLEEIATKCKELSELLSETGDALIAPPIRDDFLQVLELISSDADDMITDAESCLKRLTKEEWEEMLREYYKST